MLVIRLSRGGTKKKAFYRIVVIENSKKLGGVPVETIGYWDQRVNSLKIDNEKVTSWVKKGALLSPGIKKLLNK
jgi:small subunit ribosomal protein S16